MLVAQSSNDYAILSAQSLCVLDRINLDQHPLETGGSWGGPPDNGGASALNRQFFKYRF